MRVAARARPEEKHEGCDRVTQRAVSDTTDAPGWLMAVESIVCIAHPRRRRLTLSLEGRAAAWLQVRVGRFGAAVRRRRRRRRTSRARSFGHSKLLVQRPNKARNGGRRLPENREPFSPLLVMFERAGP
jgi:hypothetical protein